MKIKVYITILIISVICSINKVFAANWLPVKASNGKVAEINISSFNKQGNLIEYEVRQNKLDSDIVYSMVTNYTDKTTAIKSMSIYSENKQVGFEDYSKNIRYNKIKEGTLNDAVYNVLLLAKDAPALSVDSKIWDKYFNKQQNKLQRNWHPNIMQCRHYPKERAIAYVTLVIDKQGKVLHQDYQNLTNTASKYNDFNERLEKEITKAVEKVKFKPLPKEYKGDRIIVIVKFEYSYENDAILQSINFNETGIGYLECGKNFSTLSALGQLLIFPLKIPYYIFIEPFIN